MGPGKTCWAPTGPVCSHTAGEEGQAELLGSSCSPEASVKAELNPDLQLFWLREDLGMELLSAGARQDCSELQQLLGLRLLPGPSWTAPLLQLHASSSLALLQHFWKSTGGAGRNCSVSYYPQVPSNSPHLAGGTGCLTLLPPSLAYTWDVVAWPVPRSGVG